MFPLWFFPFLMFDIICIDYIAFNLLKVSLLLYNTAFFITNAIRDHIYEANCLLLKVANIKSQTQSQYKFLKTINYFLAVHTEITVQVQYVNHKVWANILLVALVTQIPINVYFCYRLIYTRKSYSALENSVIYIILFIQFWFVSGSLTPLAKYSREIHCSWHCLPSIQRLISGRYIILKLKYLNLFERITCKEMKYGHTIGHTNKTITYSTILEIFVIYFGFLLFVFKFLHRFQMHLNMSNNVV